MTTIGGQNAAGTGQLLPRATHLKLFHKVCFSIGKGAFFYKTEAGRLLHVDDGTEVESAANIGWGCAAKVGHLVAVDDPWAHAGG